MTLRQTFSKVAEHFLSVTVEHLFSWEDEGMRAREKMDGGADIKHNGAII